MQDVEKIYLIHFPMFHLEKHRHQLILEATLSKEALEKYQERKRADRTAILTLKTKEDLALAELVANKSSFKATIETKSQEGYVTTNLINARSISSELMLTCHY